MRRLLALLLCLMLLPCTARSVRVMVRPDSSMAVSPA